MTILSDRDIKLALDAGLIGVEGEYEIQPASIDLRLSNFAPQTIGRPPLHVRQTMIDPRVDIAPRYRDLNVYSEKVSEALTVPVGWVLPAHKFAIASTSGRVTIQNRHVIRLEGKSSLARLGIAVHITAGFFDPGFTGHPTLELFNFTDFDFLLIPGMPICQIAVEPLSSPCDVPYEGKYANQGAAPQPSRYHLNFA